MSQFRVNTKQPYDVISEKGLLSRAGALTAKARGVSKIMIVTDSIVAPIYLDKVCETYKIIGFDVESFIFPAGENYKTPETYLKIIGALAKAKLTRSDAVAALGGGVTGDIAGFAAATYLRGIDVIQMPTTLLAAVDSSIGGKTGVNLIEGKNLLGAFHQPRLVLFDPDTLLTLDKEEIKNGMGECVKYAVLGGIDTVGLLKDGISDALVSKCQKIKIGIVERDEKECNARKLLNLGHTLGHAIEKLSCYQISHGEAVARGVEYMAAAAYAANDLGESDYFVIRSLVDMCKSSAQQNYKYAHMREYISHDKKLKNGEKISAVVINGLGKCAVKDMDLEDFAKYIEAGEILINSKNNKCNLAVSNLNK